MTTTGAVIIGQQEDIVEAIQTTCWSTARKVAINAELARQVQAEAEVSITIFNSMFTLELDNLTL